MAKAHKKHSALKTSVLGARLRALLDVLLLLALAAGAVYGLIARPAWIVSWQLGSAPGWAILLGAAAIAALICWLRFRHNRQDAAIRKAGAAGENQALALLVRALPSDWHVFSNVTVAFDGGRSEMDLVAVGPGGVCVVEVKNYAGELRGQAVDHDLEHRRTVGRERVYNPMKQVATHVHRLSGYLREAGCGAWVRGFVLFVNPALEVKIAGRGAAPWYPASRIKELARDIQAGQPRLSATQVSAIVAALKRT